MILPIVQYPAPQLLEYSERVTEFDESLTVLISNMIETCKYEQNCVGLAGIQVGIPLRLSVIKLENKYIHIINPEIIYTSGEMTSEWEGCMSVGVGEGQLFSKVARDYKITVKYYTKERKEITRQCTGFTAHIFQHEIDHMNGILFLKYAPDPKKIWKSKDLDEYMHIHNTLPI